MRRNLLSCLICVVICGAGCITLAPGPDPQPAPPNVPAGPSDPPSKPADPSASTPTDSTPQPPSMSRDKMQLWTGINLRGANVYQRRVYPQVDGPEFLGPGPVGPPFVQSDFDRLAALGCNYVNLSLPGVFTLTPPYQVDQAMVDNLDRMLDMIARADMFAVIGFRSGPGRGEFSVFHGQNWYPPSLINQNIWYQADAQAGWAAMWRYAAERYRNHPAVIGYDLMVEPNSNHVVADQFDPNAFYAAYRNTLADWNQLFPQVTRAVREVDPRTPLLVSGNSYGSVNWLNHIVPSGDARTVYVVHNYEPMVYTHHEPPSNLAYPGTFDADDDGQPDQVDRAFLDRTLAPISEFRKRIGNPVAVTECGVQRWEPGAAAYLTDELNAQEQVGANWAIWLWTPAWEPLSVVDDFDFRHGPDPTQHRDVPNDLLESVRAAFARNTLRPSTFGTQAP